MSAIPRCTCLLLCAILLLAVTACSSPASRLQQVPTPAPSAATAVTQDATPDTHTPTVCGDPMSNPLSASSGQQPGSTAVSRTYTPTVDISRNDYEAALARWQAQQIYEYEADIQMVSRLGFKGRIHVTGDHAEAMPTIINGEQRVPLHEDLAGEFTVEALFDHVGTILTRGLCPVTGEWAFPVDYYVAFHPDMGYPTRIARSAYEPPEWDAEGRFSTAPAHSSYRITVSNLKVLRVGVPRMPSTGHPEK